jgi:hypothetical protein
VTHNIDSSTTLTNSAYNLDGTLARGYLYEYNRRLLEDGGLKVN